MTARIAVIGVGADGLAGLGARARTLLQAATTLFGGRRHLDMLENDIDGERISWSRDLGADMDKIADAVERGPVCVLASGDPMTHGIGVRIVARFGIESVDILPGPSAFSLAAARMGWALGDSLVKCISVHANPLAALAREVQPGVRLIVLSRDGDSPAEIAGLLRQGGYAKSTLNVLERMGAADERQTVFTADAPPENAFDNLNTVAVDCRADADANPLATVPGLADDAFDHDGTLTKRDVRAVTVSALAPKPGEMLWDVGAGHGSVAIEWLRAVPGTRAVAFELNADRVSRIRANAERLGTPHLEVVAGAFSDAAKDAPTSDAPDAVFVGGGIAEDPGLLDRVLTALSSGGRLVANAVTLEAQTRLLEAYQTHGGELVDIAISQAAPVGGMTAMRPALRVLQWRLKV